MVQIITIVFHAILVIIIIITHVPYAINHVHHVHNKIYVNHVLVSTIYMKINASHNVQ